MNKTSTQSKKKAVRGGRQTLGRGRFLTATSKSLIAVILVITAMAPTLTATVTGQSQQTNNPNNTVRENSPTTAAYWAKTYGGSNRDEALSVQQTSDGGYIAAGFTHSFGAGSCDMWVLKLDSTGDVTWQKTYGFPYADIAESVQQTSDGGYIVAGNGIMVSEGIYNFWVFKLSSTGIVTWQKLYEGYVESSYEGTDRAHSIRQTSDGGYIVAGKTYSFGAGGTDFWVLKLDSTGSVTWQKTYGGSGNDEAYSVQQTSDGGYIVAGNTQSFGAGSCDIWVLKLDSTGGVTWQRTYGGSSTDEACSIQQTSDDGYVVTGATYSFGAGSRDAWVLKLSSTGSITWQKTYGDNGWDEAYFVQQTSDGGYIVAGDTSSFGTGDYDAWLLKLDSTGSVAWQKTYGGGGSDQAHSVQPTSDGGYIVAGHTDSFGAGETDAWLLKLDSNGEWGGGNGAPSHTTSIVPSDSSATTSTTSVSGASSAAIVGETLATPRDSNAIVGELSYGVGTEEGIPLIIIVVVVAIVAVVAVVLVVVVLTRKKNPS